MPTKNYTFGARTPDIEQTVSDAIFAAHRYRNKLCELELAKRARHEQLLRQLAPDYVAACQAVEAAEAELADVREAIQRERTKQRTKTPTGVESEKKRAAELKSELKELRANRKQAKQSAYDRPEVRQAMDANSTQHKQECKEAKEASGLYWPTEGMVKQSCASFGSGAPPRFLRYTGEGQLALQLQGGLSTTDILDSDTRVYIEASDELQRSLAERGKARRSEYWAACCFRIGSLGRDPIFARVPIALHRPLPTGLIKWAYLERRKMADKVRWKLRLTIDVPDNTTPRDDSWVAVHYGWSLEASGLRVALWQGSDGKAGSVVLPTKHLRDYERLDQVQSDRDTAFNEAKDSLAAWLVGRELPEWLAEVRTHLAKWRSPARLAGLVWKWRDDRQSGDEAILATLDEWRKADKRRWQHQSRLSARIVRRRNDLYRVTAKQLSDRYGVLLHAKIPAKELTENSEPEALERDPTAAHRRAKWAAVSTLARFLEEKFPLHAVEVDSHYLSRQCANCGEVAPANKSKVQCAGCRKTWLSDENAIANTIARGEVRLKNGALLELVAAKEDAEQKRAERLAKMQEANRAARKAKRKLSGSGVLG